MIEIRHAVPSDAQALTIMMRKHRDELEISPELTFDFELCKQNVSNAITAKGCFILVACETHNSDTPIGYIWVSLVQPHFSTAIYLAEHYTYVLPHKRNGRALKLLLHEASVVGQICGAVYFQFGCVSGIDTCNRAYDKRFTKVGGVYHYNK